MKYRYDKRRSYMKKLYFMILFLLCAAIFSSCTPAEMPAPTQTPKQVNTVMSSLTIMDLDGLIYGSDYIFEGTVTEILPSHRNKYYPIDLETDIMVTPNNMIFGENHGSFTIRIGTGEIGNEVTVDDIFPEFSEGEKVILFISNDWNSMKDPDDEDIFFLVGVRQGKYNFISENANGESLYRRTEPSGEIYELTPSQLKSRIEELRRADPDMDAKRAAEKQRSIEAGRNSIAEMEAAKAAASMFPGSAE